MRTHHTIAGLILALAMTLTAAAQTSSSQSSTAGQAASPSQTEPSTQPRTTPQTSPQAPAGSQSQTAPQTRTTPQGQPGSAASSGQSQAAGQGSSTEDELQLTSDQKAKLQPIIQEEMVQIDAVRTENSLTMEQKQAKVAQIKRDHFPKIEAILTPEQRKKLADMQEKARQQHQAPGSSQQNPQQPPQ